MKTGWKRGYRAALIGAAALLVAGGAVAVAQAAGGGKGKAKHAVAKHLIRAGVHADVSLIRADGTTDAFAVDRGKVTAASSSSLTIQRADGKSLTFSIPTTAAIRGAISIGKPALVFSRNGAAFRVGAPGAAIAPAPLMPALQGKSPITHLDVKFLRADGSTGTYTLDRGQVTAASSTALTIKRADGASVSFTFGTTTIVRGHVRIGGKALVIQEDGAVVLVFARGGGTAIG